MNRHHADITGEDHPLDLSAGGDNLDLTLNGHPPDIATIRFHRGLAAGRWRTFPLTVQLAHVGGEVERALRWRERDRPEHARNALERGLELLDLTIADPRHHGRRRELTRLREALLDDFQGENAFGSSPESWQRYFRSFALASGTVRS